MLINKRRFLRIVLATLVAAYQLWPAAPVQAAAVSCFATVDPPNADLGTATGFTFEVENTDAMPIEFVRIASPSAAVSIDAASVADWNLSYGSDEIVLTGGSIDPGEVVTVAAEAHITAPIPQASWGITASSSADGDGADFCAGDWPLTLNQAAAMVPVISGLQLSVLSPSGVKISWSTDVAASTVIEYSTSQQYDKGASGPGNTTSHSVTLSGLIPGTAYHFRALSANAVGTGYSGEGTFMTPNLPQLVQPILSTPVNVPGAVILSAPVESEPPTVELTTNLSQSFRVAPLIRGLAADNATVARVDYSVDGGINWQPVDAVAQVSGGRLARPTAVEFSFTPATSADGNYLVMVRATDSSANTAQTPHVTLVIDRLIPQTGALAIAFGPQILQPSANGQLELVAGADYRVVTSTIGGSVNVTLEAVRAVSPAAALAKSSLTAGSFALTPSSENGLWAGVIRMSGGGTFQLVAHTTDGAANHSARVVATLQVSVPGRVVSEANSRTVTGAVVTMYVREPASRSWQVWQASSYGQANPQVTNTDGQYGFMVPAGEYYLEASAAQHTKFVSHIVSFNQPTAVSAVIQLAKQPHFAWGPLSWWLPVPTLVSRPIGPSSAPISQNQAHPLVGKAMPAFQLTDTGGTSHRDLNYTGKSTVYSLVTSWSPDGQAQLSALAEAQLNTDVNIVPIFVQQSAGEVAAYLDTAESNLAALVDPDGLLVGPTSLGASPQHIFVGRDGTVKKVMVSVLSSQELLNQLGGL